MPLISEKYIGSFYPFNKLSKKRLNYFLSLGRIREYEKDDVIYREGEPPDYFYFLLKGRVVALSSFDGESVPIEIIKKGTPFGIISLFTGEPHSVTVHAIERSYVFCIENDKFKKFLERNPLLAIDFSTILSRRVKKRANSPKRIFSSRRIGIVSGAAEKAAFTYLRSLAEYLAGETGKNVVVVEVLGKEGDASSSGEGVLRKTGVLRIGENDIEEESKNYLFVERGVSYLVCRPGDDVSGGLPSLNNFLSENFHFVLYFLKKDNLDILPFFCPLLSDLHIFAGEGDKNLPQQVKSLISRKRCNFPFDRTGVIVIGEYEPPRKMLAGFSVALQLRFDGDDWLRVRYFSRRLGEVSSGLALGSGGAYGFAHLGVLEVLGRYGIDIDMVCGSSIGALVAALWALGVPLAKIEEHIRYFGRKIKEVYLPGLSFPRRGVVKAHRLEKIFRDIFGGLSFSDTKLALGVVAFNFRTRSTKVFKRGLLYKAVAASCAMPGVFEPVYVEGELYLDGGVLSPVPADVLLKEGIRRIIAVNVTPSRGDILNNLKRKRDFFNIFDFVFGSIETMQRKIMQEALESADVIIHPDMAGYNWAEFDKSTELIRKGARAALAKIDKIQEIFSA